MPKKLFSTDMPDWNLGECTAQNREDNIEREIFFTERR
jgi:hypothetical protein